MQNQIDAIELIPGPIGPQGESGPQGEKGDTGATGATGATGPAGPQGPQGVAGVDGQDGAKGDKGDTGATGATGLTGPAGPQGPQGVAGNDGADGQDGAPGAQGQQGIKGDKGDKGDIGATGATGATGPAGPQGPQGDSGISILAGQSCPSGQAITGIDAQGGILCMNLGGGPVSDVEITFTSDISDSSGRRMDINGRELVVDGETPTATLGGQPVTVLAVAELDPLMFQLIIDIPYSYHSGTHVLAVNNVKGTDTSDVTIFPVPMGRFWTHQGNVTGTSNTASVVLNGKIFVMGGDSHIGPGAIQSTVWSSLDGVNWTVELNDGIAPWDKRNGHTSVVHNGLIYILGGRKGSGQLGTLNDVWSSPDGVNWTEVSANGDAPWAGRSYHTSVVHNGKIYIIGGFTDGPLGWRNDVWSSPDGVNWTEESANGVTPWSKRDRHTSVVHNSKIFVIGGNEGNDVWSSPDGTNWTNLGNAPWSGRDRHTSVVYDGNIYVLGGRTSADINDVWSSPDGASWTEVYSIGAAPWTGRWGHTSVVHNNKVFVIGGKSGSQVFGDIWSSEEVP